MRKSIVVLGAVLLLAAGVAGCDRGPATVPAALAAEKGDLQVTAQGIGLDSMSVTMTSTRNDTIVFPVGTRFNSASAGTQNMMAARTVTFVFSDASPESPQTIVQPIPVYCLNRWLDVPTSASGFTVSYTEETDLLRKLAACIEDKPMPHRAKQLAIWMVSDDLMDLSPDELAGRFLDETEKKWRQLFSDGDAAATEIQKLMPDADAELLGRVRQMTSDELGALLEMVRPTLRENAMRQVKEYLDATPALLAECGYDLSAKRLFRP